MAHESGFTHLDGKPCEPIIRGYPSGIFMCFLGSSILIAFTCAFLKEFGFSHNFQINFFLFGTLILGSIISTIFYLSEYKSRKIVFKQYNKELDIYLKRRAIVENNGGVWKSDEERYKEMFGIK